MKKIIYAVLVAMLVASCTGGHRTEKFTSQDGSVKATRHGDKWSIVDSTGREVVEQYDSMRVLEVGEDGHPMSVKYYKGDEEHLLQYYSNMQLRGEGVMKNGLREGRWVYYHPNGMKQVEAFFVNGKEQGPYRVYRDNGIPVYVGTYTDGKPSGVWEVYDNEGQLVQKSEY